MGKKKVKYTVGRKNCVVKSISKDLDKQIKKVLTEVKSKNPLNKDKITYTWVTDNIEVRLIK